MATIINNPQGNAGDSATGFIVGAVLVLIILGGFLMYLMNGFGTTKPETEKPTTNIKVELPDVQPQTAQ